MSTTARIDANRKNAQLSTGPRTEAGKQRSRLNALKHGLRSEEVVLPNEDRSEFDSHLAAWMDDWQPPTETRRFLVERAAVGAWRLNRLVRNETTRIEARTRRAEVEWDKTHDDQVANAVRLFDRQPEASMAILSASRDGVNRLSGFWNQLDNALSDPKGWSDIGAHHNRLCALLGVTGTDDPAPVREAAEASWGLLVHNDPEADDTPSPLDDAGADRARSILRDLCCQMVESVNSDRYDALPEHPASRAEYAKRKANTPQPEDTLAHRYEGRLDREVRATIGLLIKLQQTGIDLMAGADPVEPEPPSQPAEPVAAPPTEAKEPTPKVSAPNEAIVVPAQGLITKVDHDPMGMYRAVQGGADVPMSVGIPLSNR